MSHYHNLFLLLFYYFGYSGYSDYYKSDNFTILGVEEVRGKVIYEDDEIIQIWKYDLRKTQNGPIDVEIKMKKGYIHPNLKNNKKYTSLPVNCTNKI